MPTGPASSLRELCLARNASLLLAACRAAETECGDFSQPACVARVEGLQGYLLECLGNLMNDVCSKAHELMHELLDARILFAIEIQRYVRSFVFRNDVMFASINRDIGFWKSQLGKLTSVTVIDIRTLLCTDGMINAICDNCLQLEEFRFMTHLFTLGPTGHDLITTSGVQRLLELENLRIVDDTFNFQYFPNDFLKKFFNQLLPRLENFSHENLQGLVLDNVGELTSLRLTDVMLHDVRPAYVLALLRLCPRLQHLRLKQPYGGVFDNLTDSSASLAGLQLDRFSGDYVPGLCHFLLNKGDRLTSLVLRTDALISVHEVSLVGECCLNLQHLELTLRARRATHPPSGHRAPTDRPIFGKLWSLSLGGPHNGSVDPRIADLFLRHDSGITSLTLNALWLSVLDRVLPPPPSSIMFPNLSALTIRMHPRGPLPPSSNALIKTLCRGSTKLTYLHVYTDEFQWDRRSDLWSRFFDEEEHLSRRNVRLAITGLHMAHLR